MELNSLDAESLLWLTFTSVPPPERTETWVTIWTQEMGNSFRPSVSSFKSKQWRGQNGRAAETVFEL